MSLFHRMRSRSRVRTARAQLAENPCARNYLNLANEHARVGEMDEALRVCKEGLIAFPGYNELVRLESRARQLELEGRTRELSRELREAPRPALYHELCQLLLQSGRLSRAEECALEWFNVTGDGQAQLFRAQARAERFFADRRSEDGRLAFELLDAAEELLGLDERVFRLRLQLSTRIGAWRESRRAVSRLLELHPGDPVLEARFRTLLSLAESAPTLDQALREVEKSGRFVDDEPEQTGGTGNSVSLREMLQNLASEPGVHAVVYGRGATALVQGPRGATAERTARCVREVVQKSRTTSRRLGLGQIFEVQLDGDFGTLLVAPGELGAGAVWSDGSSVPREALFDLISAGERDSSPEEGDAL